MNKIWVFGILLLAVNSICYGQNAVAMLKFEDAEKAYNAGDYPKVLQALEEVEELVGVTSKTLYLRIVSQNELFAGGINLYDGPEQFQLLTGLREHVTTYLDAMGSHQGLDDKYRTVYRIQESLAAFPTTQQEWQVAYEREEAKKITKEYHANGQLKSVGKVDDGKKTGEWKYYDENGLMFRVELYTNGFKQSAKYYNATGVLVWHDEYDSDRLGGFVRKMYHENKQLKLIESWRGDGRRRDTYKEYYENGQLRIKQAYSSGPSSTLTGEYKAYHENGQLHIDTEYHEGQIVGGYKEYHANGQLAEQGEYEMGEIFAAKIGKWEYYHANGQIEKVENYLESGSKEGEVKTYYKSGKLKSVAQYDDDIRISFREYYESGQLSLTVLPEDEGYWKYYHENGQLKGLGRFITEKGQYRYGKWKSYHENGQLAKVENYYAGMFDGRWESYYQNGQLKAKGKYKDGKKRGKWRYFDEQGNRNN